MKKKKGKSLKFSNVENNVQSYNIPCDSKIGKIYYKNCISLGCFCGVASSMSRYGLRSHSGPFDWITTYDFKSALKMIEMNFSDFMVKDNLSVAIDNNRWFNDNKYGFVYPHEIKYDFETEYESIYQKYIRRIKQFLQDIKYPTFFIRAVRSKEEILYIEENREYIYRIIQKENPNSEIAFLILSGMQKLSNNYLWFRLSNDKYLDGIYEMRTMFDSSSAFSELCMKHILPEESIAQNKQFDYAQNKARIGHTLLYQSLNEFNNHIALALSEYYPNINQGIYLWGAGKYGTLMLQYLIKNGIPVKGIVDNAADKIGTLCEGIPIVPFSNIKDSGQNIFIAISSDTEATEVQKQILDTYPDAKILKLSYLSDMLFV